MKFHLERHKTLMKYGPGASELPVLSSAGHLTPSSVIGRLYFERIVALHIVVSTFVQAMLSIQMAQHKRVHSSRTGNSDKAPSHHAQLCNRQLIYSTAPLLAKRKNAHHFVLREMLPRLQFVLLLGLLALKIKKTGLEGVLTEVCVVGLVVWCCVQVVRSSRRRAKERDRFLQSHVLVLKKELPLARQCHNFYMVANGKATVEPGARITGHSDWRKCIPMGDSGPWNETRILFAVDKKDVTGPIDVECTQGDKVIIDLTWLVGVEDGRLIIKDAEQVARIHGHAHGGSADVELR
jgi:hypothetical protein